MSFHDHRLLLVVGTIVLVLVVFVGIELLIVAVNGHNVPTPTIPRQQTLGKGKSLNYLVMGDSSAVAQGTDYSHGYPYLTAQHLAANYAVELHNVAVSGARAKDVLNNQLPDIGSFKPDVVLIGVGGNDVTHLTSSSSVMNSLSKTIDNLVALNCNVKILVTGAPDMGAVPRFPQPLRALAGQQTGRLNKVFSQVVAEKQITFAPVALETGPTLRKNPSYFAQDNFHLKVAGYKLWVPVINDALDEALATQSPHC